MRRQLVDLLAAYLMGWKALHDLAEWLAGIDWNDPNLDLETRQLIGRFELLATEVLEGQRLEAEFWPEAVQLVAAETNSIYSRYGSPFAEASITRSSNDVTFRPPTLVFPIRPSTSVVELKAEELPSWSISPRLVPA